MTDRTRSALLTLAMLLTEDREAQVELTVFGDLPAHLADAALEAIATEAA